ncbi:MAG: hypothetical protein V3R93_07895 [Candidatus Hydrothermarchaeaceae archaeon]
MDGPDDILSMLKQEPLVNVGIGAVLGLALIFLFDRKNNQGTNEQQAPEERALEVKDKLKKIKKMEAKLAEM